MSMVFAVGSTVRLHLNGLPVPVVGKVHQQAAGGVAIMVGDTPCIVNTDHIVMMVLVSSAPQEDEADGAGVVGRIGVL